MLFRRYLAVAAGAGTLVLADAPAAAAPHSYTIVIDQLKFAPVPAQLHKGDILVWDNRDLFRHSATATDHSFDVDLPPHAKARLVLNKAGAIAFFCKYHPGMRGVLRVK